MGLDINDLACRWFGFGGLVISRGGEVGVKRVASDGDLDLFG